MEKRIELEMRGRAANQIKDLNLDNCRVTEIEGLTSDFSALESLSMINVGLQSLSNFPKLGNLKKLDLSDNRISGGLQALTGCPKLTHLSLSGNKIKEIDALKPLKDLPNLKSLDLFNCEVTNLEEYREKVFEMLEQISFLDGFDQNDKECEDDEEDAEEIDGEDDDDDDVFVRDDEEEEDFDPEGDDDDDELGEGEEEEEDGEEAEDGEDGVQNQHPPVGIQAERKGRRYQGDEHATHRFSLESEKGGSEWTHSLFSDESDGCVSDEQGVGKTQPSDGEDRELDSEGGLSGLEGGNMADHERGLDAGVDKDRNLQELDVMDIKNNGQTDYSEAVPVLKPEELPHGDMGGGDVTCCEENGEHKSIDVTALQKADLIESSTLIPPADSICDQIPHGTASSTDKVEVDVPLILATTISKSRSHEKLRVPAADSVCVQRI
ncbi:hypothetical protein BaRGS_00032986 [Batillaria attramentaria]|uniref:Acidic leucine-rich nuclear phosphoprotein 32 family member A n=1 Tax=Batillaria attramentaria TaxID=370345 RepID=A0ABD0JM41_9CAEN